MSKVTLPSKDQLRLEETKIQGGVFGKVFGIGEQFSKTSLFLIILLLIVVGVIYIFRDFGVSLAYWKDIFLPMFTLLAGYFLGQKQKN